MKDERVVNSLHNSWAALVAMVKSLFKLMPVLMVCFTSLMITLAEKFANNTSLQLAMLAIVIFFSSIAVYFKSKNYGEAVLALSAGLFTVFTVTWTKPLFICFIVIWLAFTLIVLLATSIRLASKSQSLYMEAALVIKPRDLSSIECEKRLQAISNNLKDSILGPLEKAEIIRAFAYRKIPIEKMELGIKWVNIYYSLTRIPYLVLADFVADIMKNATIIKAATEDDVFNHIYLGMRQAPVLPQEYIDAFRQTRHILVKSKRLILYFQSLNSFFDSGVAPDNIEEYLEQAVQID